MSFITRCSACGTMFKVVTDQLKVSQGWVRCGCCTEVFDATANLLPSPVTPSSPLPSVLTPDDLSLAPPLPAPEHAVVDSMPALAVLEPPRDGNPVLPEVEPASDGIRPGSAVDFADADAIPDVSFVRDARRQAFWRKPMARLALGLLLLLLLALLALQWVMQRKDTLAALEPRLTPLLQTLCSQMGCEISVPRHIESLVIDSSTFRKIGTDTYRLSFVLKNTALTPLQIPSLEVSLTDVQDQVVVRRVLAPAQFGAGSAALAAQSELAGSVTLKVLADASRMAVPPVPELASPAGSLRVAGYRILAFYP